MKVLGIHSSPRFPGSHSLFPSISGIMLQGVLDEIKLVEKDAQTEIIHLDRFNIQPCRGCFSDVETRCHYLCDCYDDDFSIIAQKIIEVDAVVFATPTYMFGMSSSLKRFFERWISFKAPRVRREKTTKNLEECLEIQEKLISGELIAGNPLRGKVGGIVVAGSELGQDSVAKDIMLLLNLYGFLLPPQCFIYHTGHSMQSLDEVRASFYENEWLIHATRNLARSIVQLVELISGTSWPEMPKILSKP